MWIIAIDLVLLTATVLRQHVPFKSRASRELISFLDLGREMNFGAWWAGIILFLVALICYEVASTSPDRKRMLAWCSVSVLFLGLSLDEMASIHERVELGWGVIAIGVVALIAWLVLAPWVLFKEQDTRWSAIIILAGFILMATAAGQEYLEHNVEWAAWASGLRVGLEEGAEIAGAFLCLLGAVKQRRRSSESEGLSRLVPNPLVMKYPTSLLIVGSAIHLVAAIATTSVVEIEGRGNPALFVPTVLFVVASALAFWKAPVVAAGRRWFLMSGSLLLLSLLTFYLLSPRNESQLVSDLGQSLFIWALYVLAGVMSFVWLASAYRTRALGPLIALVLAAIMTSMFDSELLSYVASGACSAFILLILFAEHRIPSTSAPPTIRAQVS